MVDLAVPADVGPLAAEPLAWNKPEGDFIICQFLRRRGQCSMLAAVGPGAQLQYMTVTQAQTGDPPDDGADVAGFDAIDDYSSDNFYKKANDKKTQNGGVANRFYNNNNPQGNTTWFQEGTYEDGYKYGDLNVGIGGTVVDILGNVAQGVGNFGEGVSDLGLYLGGGLADLFGFDSFAEENKKKAQKNTVNDFFDQYINPTTDKDSFLGEKSDSLAQGVGYVLPSVAVSLVAPHLGIGAVGTSALTTGGTFASSMGSGMSEAYNAGATDSEAWKYGFSSGLIEAGTELMFGGLGGSARTLGLTSGIGGLDDILANKLTSGLKSRVAKTLVKAGIKATGEGVEEVAAGYLSAIAKHRTYASEKEFDELVKDENLLESFIGGAFVGGVFQVGNVASSIKTGRDIITGFTSREEAVVDALYNETVNNAKAKGQKLTKSDLAKIREQSEEAVRNGEVSVELIEKTLGGDAQKGLDALSAEADEFEQLYKTPGGELSREQQNRLDELEAKNKERSFEERKKEARQGLRQSVRDASAKDQYIGRAYVEEGKKYKAYSVNAKEYSGKGRAVVENAMKAGFLNDSSNTHKFVDLVAKLATEKGLEFDFTSNEKLKNSGFAIGGRVINGFVRGGKITVNMNAAKVLNSVVGHEITHVLEGTQLYNELQTALFRYAQGKKDYNGRRKTLEELYKNVKGADVDAELMADAAWCRRSTSWRRRSCRSSWTTKTKTFLRRSLTRSSILQGLPRQDRRKQGSLRGSRGCLRGCIKRQTLRKWMG